MTFVLLFTPFRWQLPLPAAAGLSAAACRSRAPPARPLVPGAGSEPFQCVIPGGGILQERSRGGF